MKKIRYAAALLLLAALSLTLLCSCDFIMNGFNEFADDPSERTSSSAEPASVSEQQNVPTSSRQEDDQPESKPKEDGWYYDLEPVVNYLASYGKLPSNYITKKEAEALGWSGGSVENYKPGAAIGGDYFGNYEKILPVVSGRTYTECDLSTNGGRSRGAKRLIFSNDGHYYYTEDHYESFKEVIRYENGSISFGKEYK